MPEESIFFKFRWQIASILFGAILIGAGVLISNITFFESTKIEVIESSSSSPDSGDSIVIEVAGSVNSPGVYEFAASSRIQDALNRAGGLSPEADTEYVNRTINKAAKLLDGQKIYIPAFDEAPSLSAQSEDASSVNINSASSSQLESLWGIGPATAQSIISNRPYASVEELLNKKILKSNVYERNKSILSVF